ncbi:MAG: hypothetical protein OXE85_01265 [Roseovarius sp.]|nr:hypothetical protein [Roseovarius sp.]
MARFAFAADKPFIRVKGRNTINPITDFICYQGHDVFALGLWRK